jgi:hypothetical protein
MLYQLAVSVLFGLLYGEAAYARALGAVPLAALAGFVGVFLSLLVPPRLFKYSMQMGASEVLAQLMHRAVLGSGVLVATSFLVWLLIGHLSDPGALGEMYVFAAIGIFVFHVLGETMADHALYLQRTHQYNSDQLVAVLLTVTLLLFVLILYFLAFDLSRSPEFHAYSRDLTAITLILIGYGRAVYMIAHH